MAKAAGCQKSFLSQVLRSHVHLTPEHALGIASFLELPDLEREYFIELVNFARAGTPALKDFTARRLRRIKAESENFARRFEKASSDFVQPQADAPQSARWSTYYSHWYYSAVHFALTIPELQQEHALQRRLELPSAVIKKCVRILEDLKLIRSLGDRWEVVNRVVHLPRDSYLTPLYHQVWRQKAIQSSFTAGEADIHYTSVYSLSRTDSEKLRQLLLEFIDSTRSLVGPSPEEELVGMTCDLFRV